MSLHDAVKRSFNRITVDGDMSTNDTVLIIANGMLGNSFITEKSRSYGIFRDTLSDVAYELSKLVVRDGEGATKFIDIEVRGARSEAEAEKAAFSVANSNLVKTAMYGNDANWGRIMAALGYSGVSFPEDRVDIFFGKVKVVSRGLSNGMDKEAGQVLRGREIPVVIDLRIGRSSARVLTCDMTEEYIKVNATYRT
jgi:glutamate N-acetyltransferase/amino-acid N-acetyltransferase